MKKNITQLISAFLLFGLLAFASDAMAQTSTTFNYTGTLASESLSFK